MLSQAIKAGNEMQARYEATVITDPELVTANTAENVTGP